MEGAGRRVQRIEQRDHAQAVGTNDDLWQGRRGHRQDRAAEGGCAQGPQGLEDRRQAAQAPRYPAQGDRRASLRHRPEAARHAVRGDQGLPVFGGKLTRFDAANVQGMPGVKHVVKVGDSAVAVVTDRWWQAKTALDALPATWDEGPNAKVSSASIAEFIKGGFVLRPSDTRFARLRPPVQPSSRSRCRKASVHCLWDKAVLVPRNPWSETTAPPSNVMNSRRLT